MPARDNDRGLKSIKKTLDIINLISELNGARTSEIAAELDIPKSTVHIHLQSLLDRRYLVKENDIYYTGLKFLDIGIQTRERLPIVEAAHAELETLAEKTEETVWLFTEEEGLCVYLDLHTSDQSIRARGRVGKREKMHYVSGGKVQLAHMNNEKVEEIIDRHGLPKKTENTITNKRQLFDELETIRENGYAVNDVEEIPGVYAVAAPILYNQDVVGAVSVSGPENRMKQNEKKEMVQESVLAAGNTISLKLDYD
ncbi:IclR family transcriptional regulator [Natrinema sp. 74]|uniref:IclR family transcriptional regulator n=1 Tax=Natrinema sp. 74 TaxID=3384159 RepID=UPI0038D4E3E6